MAMESFTTSWPVTRSEPRSGCNSVATVLMKVDFPAPLGPRMATTCPDWMVRSSSLRAWTFPNRLLRPSASMRAGMCALLSG
jgi:hypothetical protein